MTIDYDPQAEALLHPERRETVFTDRAPPSAIALAAEASRLAYVRAEASTAEHDRLAESIARAGFGQLATFADEPTSTQAFAALHADDGTALVAVRGTETDRWQDVVTDVRFLPRPFGGGLVHGGFLDALEAIAPSLQAWLRDAAPARRRLLICGHSLGGAVATLLAALEPACELVTFGSPRVGDAAFGASLAGVPVTRVVDCCDIVATVPPAGPLFRHVGALRYITREGRVLDEPEFDVRLADGLAARADYLAQYAFRSGVRFPRELQDHAPINYVRAFFD